MRKRKKKKLVRSNALAPKQRLFAAAVAGGATNIDAMRRAGYTGNANTLSVQANRLLRNPKIADHIEKHRAAVEQHLSLMTADECLALASTLARGNIADFVFYDNNKLTFKPMEEIPRHKFFAVESIRIKDTAFGKDRSIKMHASWPAIDRLGQYFKHWGEKISVEHSGDLLDRALLMVPGFDDARPRPAG